MYTKPENALQEIEKVMEMWDVVKAKGKAYVNIPICLDIETSSTTYSGDKICVQYAWCLNIDGIEIMGREWSEFFPILEYFQELGNEYEINFVIYVHNLAYEFQFIRKWLEWSTVFARKARKPMKAVSGNIEFRCSYILSGLSLSTLAKTLNMEKPDDYDYGKLRLPCTPMDEKEIYYLLNDTRVVNEYIRRLIVQENGINNIPLTQTGFVRKTVKSVCYPRDKKKSNQRKKFTELMSGLTIEKEEYRLLKRAFCGGFTHCNALCSGKTIENVGSYDLSSAYPGVMFAEKFPMSKGVEVDTTSINRKQFEYYMKNYCCIFDISFKKLEANTIIENPLSRSKCFKCENVVENNGRVVSADYCLTTLTNVDWSYWHLFYDWESCVIHKMYIYVKNYLPTEYATLILDYFDKKTTLKGVDDREEEYLKSKQEINSLYGMMVTDINGENVIYDGEWKVENTLEELEKTLDKNLEEYNKKKTKITFYPWGIFVTSYTRRNLFRAILAAGYDYCYSDTDSAKFQNPESHSTFFENENKMICKKNDLSLQHHGNIGTYKATTIKGKEKTLGIWEYEGTYEKFKSLGAKRYLTEDENGERHLTVSGLQKSAVKVVNFDNFTDNLTIPGKYSGRTVSFYGDEEFTHELTDFMGNKMICHEKSFVHLQESDFTMNIAQIYHDYLMSII